MDECLLKGVSVANVGSCDCLAKLRGQFRGLREVLKCSSDGEHNGTSLRYQLHMPK